MKAIQSKSAGKTVYIQITEEPEIIQTESSEGFAATVDIREKLEEIAETTNSVCKTLFDKVLTKLGDEKPNEFQIEFGIVLAGKAGIPLITEASAECALKVTAKWTS